MKNLHMYKCNITHLTKKDALHRALFNGYNQNVTSCGSQTKTCSCYSTKTHINSVILILKLNLTFWETYTLKCVWCSTKTTFNVYVSQRSQIQFEDKDHAVYMSFLWVTTTLSSLRTTTCDALIVSCAICLQVSYSQNICSETFLLTFTTIKSYFNLFHHMFVLYYCCDYNQKCYYLLLSKHLQNNAINNEDTTCIYSLT